MTPIFVRGLLSSVVFVLFSAINTLAQSDFVYIHSGSAIAGFSVNPNGALLSVPGSPFLTGGADSSTSGFFGANRIIVSGNFLYASHGQSGSISGFAIDSNTGRLTAVPSSPFFGVGVSLSGVSLGVTPSGKFLYAVNLGLGTIRVYSISPNGALTDIAAFFTTIGAPADGIKISPDGRFLAITLPFNLR